MQDELKNVISQAMNSNSEFEQESIPQFAEGELSDEALEAVAGGVCINYSKDRAQVNVLWTAACFYGAGKKLV